MVLKILRDQKRPAPPSPFCIGGCLLSNIWENVSPPMLFLWRFALGLSLPAALHCLHPLRLNLTSKALTQSEENSRGWWIVAATFPVHVQRQFRLIVHAYGIALRVASAFMLSAIW